jgi:CheY-like chemotaxis protein
MNRLLIVENQPDDQRIAAELACSMGFSVVDVRASVLAAKGLLENALEGDAPLPDAMILELDLGFESGFELLRFWHSHPRLFSIPLIVWTALGEDQREMCSFFSVDAFIRKSEEIGLLRQALDGHVVARTGSTR